MQCGWIQDITFGTCLKIFELLSVSFAAVNYEIQKVSYNLMKNFHFSISNVFFSVFIIFFGMSSYGPESCFFETFIIWGIFSLFILLSYLSPLKSYCHFCDKITTVSLLWSRKSHTVDPPPEGLGFSSPNFEFSPSP